ncbi:hypothetical protein [Syntrophomonas palmitatica]|uniref:hypothetical protein n=1 Tax=Syntrophomonas palmitatica TaxID=402877 RepID=UPI0006D11104|nr:hypothetical protein [Syntrophomonas palmitatica]
MKKQQPLLLVNNPTSIISTDCIELYFGYTHPSANQYMRWHWAKRKEAVDEWHWLVKVALKGQKIIFKKPVISSDYYFTDNRERDRGNFVPKFTIDALVKEGVIPGDSCKSIVEEMPNIHLKQQYKGLKITIKEAV